jgi:hypothetical protein
LLRQAQHERKDNFIRLLFFCARPAVPAEASAKAGLKDIFERKFMLVHVGLNRSSGASERHGIPDNTTEQSEVWYRRQGF